MNNFDIAIIGGGIVGLTTAYTLSKKYPDKSFVVIEKENTLGAHQSSRNSGVIHSGIYYKPGSLKAQNCTKGKQLLYDFCHEHSINYKVCGKVIVASSESELPNLTKLHERSLANGVECRSLKAEEIKEVEPYLIGVAGIHIPSVAVIKFKHVVNKIEELLRKEGRDIRLNSEVKNIKEADSVHVIETASGEIKAKYIINTAGLYCDRIAKMATGKSPVQIIPFRGEYYELKEEARKYCRALIYPVPDPNYPFLGVHVTRMVDDKVECGPNAVLAMAREGYKWNNLNLADLAETFTHTGFLKFAAKNLMTGIYEMRRSFSKALFLKSIQTLIPDIQSSDIAPGEAGVRAQAIAADGKLLDDFFIYNGKNQMHVLNAPSPAATSSFSIAETLLDKFFSN